jgi:hypothetical protein
MISIQTMMLETVTQTMYVRTGHSMCRLVGHCPYGTFFGCKTKKKKTFSLCFLVFECGEIGQPKCWRRWGIWRYNLLSVCSFIL